MSSTTLERDNPPLTRGARGQAELPETAPPLARLFSAPHEFDFFQAVRLLESAAPSKRGVGRHALPSEECVRFRAASGAEFPASAIADLQPPGEDEAGAATPAEMTISFLGLTGPSGVLPAHYTDLLLRLERDLRTPEKQGLRGWFDLFNHRLASLFYRAWEKYRPLVAFQRGDYRGTEPDLFTRAMLSLAGLPVASCAAPPTTRDDRTLSPAYRLPRALVRYAGLLAQRPRNATNLQAILADYFALPIAVEQFCGEWLPLADDQQARLGVCGALGCDAIVGPRLWDRQSKVRIRIGPLDRATFERLLPIPSATDETTPRLAEVAAVVRFYLGPGLDFDLQLILKQTDVPSCTLGANHQAGAHLGWNTWLAPQPSEGDRADAMFAFGLEP